jgi:putative DNA primase/helicase
LHEKYPQKPIVIAGDDDFTQESINGKNPGREKAMEAAKLVNGAVVFPTFAPDEQVSQN